MQQENFIRAIACGVALAVAPSVATAQERETEQMDTVIVTATRTEKELDSAPGSASVVTKQEIEKKEVLTFDDALKGTSGVMLSRSKGPMDTIANITLRGVPGQNRTLIMVDGITLNSPFAGSIQSNSIAPGTIERIEIVKGATSSLYGGNAMGGVVNVITKMPTKREFTLKTGFGSALEGDAPENTRRVAVSYGDVIKDKFHIYLYNDYTGTDGYVTDLVTGTPGSGTSGARPTLTSDEKATFLLGHKGENEAWQDNLTVKAGYDFNSSTKLLFTFLKSYGEYSYNDPETYMTDSSGNPYWSSSGSEYSFLGTYGANNQNIYALSLETETASAKIKAGISYLDQDTSWYATASSTTKSPVATRSDGPGKLTSTPASALSADVQVTFPLLSWNIFTVGGAFRQSEINGKDYALSDWTNEHSKGQLIGEARGTDRIYALFMQDEISILDNLTLYAGFRQDWWETSDGHVLASNASNVVTVGPTSFGSRSESAFSPKGAIVYTPFEGTTLKVSGGKAFRAPSNYELYRTTMMGSSTTYQCNPDLKPERSVSWDGGVSQDLWQGATVKATYFENYIKDMIYSTTTGSTREKKNAGRGESKGVEVEVEQKFGKLLRLFANYTYTNAKITKNSAVPATEGKRMTDIPRTMYNAGADLEYGPAGASVIARYVGKRYGNDTNNDTARNVKGVYDSYITTDVKLRYKLTSWATASFSVNNIFDEKYFSSTKSPGRSCYGEVTLQY